MKKFFEQHYNKKKNKVEWPSVKEEKEKLARILYGLNLVKKMDYWINYAKDLVEKPEREKPFVRKNKAYREDKKYREVFSTLNNEQKEMFLELIQKVTSGVLFSSQVLLDQCGYGEYQIQLNFDSENKESAQITSKDLDLHDEFVEWVYEFSEFGKKIYPDFDSE